MGSEALRSADAKAREAAQHVFDRPLVLEAGAGTGKTATLVARIVAWSMGYGWQRAEALERKRATSASKGEHTQGEGAYDRIAAALLSRIAAITFTEAAAAEMAERVGESLSQVERGEDPLALDMRVLPDSIEEGRTRARALIGALDHLVVRTIHAFCRRLLSRYPLEAGMHPGFEVDADERGRQSVVREVVESALRRADLPSANPALLELADRGFGPGEVEVALDSLLEEGVSPEAFARDPLAPDRVRAGFFALRAHTLKFAAANAGRLDAVTARSSLTLSTLEAIEHTGRLCADTGAQDKEALWSLGDRLRALWPDNLRKRLTSWAGDTFNNAEAGALAGEAGELVACAGELRQQLLPMLDFDPALIDCGRRALLPLLEHATEELHRRGVIGFSELLRGAHALLRDRPELRADLRRQLDLLLVDEFQDTDPIQCEIVRLLALDGPEESRPSLFLVGDPKQSIYGWRSADLGAYDAFVAGVLAQGGQRLSLSVNFRSVPAILDEVEKVIEPVMHEEAGRQPPFRGLVPCPALESHPGFTSDRHAPVEHWLSWGWSAEAEQPDPELRAGETAALEARALALDLTALHEQEAVGWNDVGILMRSTTDLEVYLSALREAGIPYVVERERSYYRRREVVEATAALRCVLDPNDDMALLVLLRSASVGVPDAALIPLWSGGLPGLASALAADEGEGLSRCDALIRQVAADLPDNIPGLPRVKGWEHCLVAALESIAALRVSFDADPPDIFVEKLRSLLLIETTEAGRYLGAFRAANLDRLFRELSEELASGSDPQEVLRRMRLGVSEGHEVQVARAPAQAHGAVQVMTIHKAKGLAFGHVYVVQLHKAGGGGRARPLELGEGEGGLELRLFGATTPGFAAVAAKRAAVEAAERVRTLYVAMTRARKRLVLVGRWSAAPEAVPISRVRSAVGLLASRNPLPPDLTAVMLAARAAGGACDRMGARWRFPAFFVAGTAPRLAGGESTLRPQPGDEAEIDDGLRELAARWESARREMLRPMTERASGLAHPGEAGLAASEQTELRAEVGFGESGAGAPGSGSPAATAAGSAIHRMLEDFDVFADSEAELARQTARLPDLIGALAPPGAVEEAVRRATEILEHFAGGLLRDFVALGDRIVARELSVWMRPAADTEHPPTAVGFVSGAIDLLYRDATTGRLVVADYKTDRVRTADELQERGSRYLSQGALYAAALRQALGLDYTPRFEFWFVDAGRVVQGPVSRAETRTDLEDA